MVLDQQEVVAVGAHLGEVSLLGSHVGQPLHPFAQVRGAVEPRFVRRNLTVGPGTDHPIERRFAQCRTQRTDEIDAQLAMPIGEGGRSGRSQLPVHGRPSAAGRLGHRSGDHAGFFERIEVLAQRGVGEPELDGEIGGRCRLDALETFHDPALGVGQLGSPENSTWDPAYFGSLALHNRKCARCRRP